MLDIECKKVSYAFCREVRLIEQIVSLNIRSSNGKMFVVSPSGRIGCSYNAIRALCYLCQKKDFLVSKSDLEDYVWQGGVV